VRPIGFGRPSVREWINAKLAKRYDQPGLHSLIDFPTESSKATRSTSAAAMQTGRVSGPRE
jgi:hypothetical protein